MKTYIEVPKILIVVQSIANHKTIGYFKANIWKKCIEKTNVNWKCFLIILQLQKNVLSVTYSQEQRLSCVELSSPATWGNKSRYYSTPYAPDCLLKCHNWRKTNRSSLVCMCLEWKEGIWWNKWTFFTLQLWSFWVWRLLHALEESPLSFRCQQYPVSGNTYKNNKKHWVGNKCRCGNADNDEFHITVKENLLTVSLCSYYTTVDEHQFHFPRNHMIFYTNTDRLYTFFCKKKKSLTHNQFHASSFT